MLNLTTFITLLKTIFGELNLKQKTKEKLL